MSQVGGRVAGLAATGPAAVGAIFLWNQNRPRLVVGIPSNPSGAVDTTLHVQ